ncbi:RelA/SpoT family protein [Derxia lacustris]|uniref:RelA/SpoT family protein n=1 Tax=Derxia lacustris TaxID=764842 RepID=UPI000A16D117|nr:bifunctional (p)ppGpp synthetase/guanosine-3',5'-bis(diphosphate) 3'-pyrophosphohydrolase [Derxia lacustris]
MAQATAEEDAAAPPDATTRQRKPKSPDGARDAEPPRDEFRSVASFAPLAEVLGSYLSESDLARVREAYRFADEAHLGQFRQSGEPYISHPIAVAELCSQWKLDAQAMIAALLHDVIEDQGVTKQELVERFGAPVAELVDGLSKLDRLKFPNQQDAQAENFRKMMLAMARDVRVILIKLADRLHNMRTLGAVPSHKQRRIARETLDIYAPIAHRLGLNQIFRELQDLSFAYLYPTRFSTLRKAVLAARGNRREVVNKILNQIGATLPSAGIQAQVFGREKSLYGIYRKMREKRLSFSQVLDVYGFRIVVERREQCYLALGLLHGLFKPVPGKFKDFIAVPKFNGYQSLHTTLVGPFGTPVEFQIRTEEMHHVAESGVAAHWLYKDEEASVTELQQRTHSWLQSLIEVQNQTGDAGEFFEHVKVDLFPDSVYVFTPKSKIISLPRGATPLDFAYQIHTDIGNSSVGARVNGLPVSLRTELHSGDIVEVETDPHGRPNPNWLGFVRTARARFEIRHALRTTNLAESVALGESLLRQALVALEVDPSALPAANYEKLVRTLGARSLDEVHADIGLGRRIAAVVARRLLLATEGATVRSGVDSDGARILIHGTEGMAIQLAPCCSPIPGDTVSGYLRKGHGLIVHTRDCETARRLRAKDPERWLDDVAWAPDLQRSFDARVHLLATNARGVLGKIAAEIASSDANINRVATEDFEPDGSIAVDATVQVADRDHLALVMRNLRRLPEILKISRPRG